MFGGGFKSWRGDCTNDIYGLSQFWQFNKFFITGWRRRFPMLALLYFGRAAVRTSADKKVRILTGDKSLDQLTRETVDALYKRNFPIVLYQQGPNLVRFRNGSGSRPLVDLVTTDVMINRMAETCKFLARSPNGGLKQIFPPMTLARNILAESSWPFPELKGVVESPVLRPDGTVLESPGYDLATGLFYAPAPDLDMMDAPLDPSRAQVRAALRLIGNIFADFPFLGDADRANTLAALLTPILRPAITGPVPMFALDAPKQGTGKTLIASVISIIATGRPPNVKTIPGKDDENEWRKFLTAELRQSPTVVILDNADRQVRSAALAAMLTTTSWSDRLLGASEILHLPASCFWVLTGNNLSLSADLIRRTFASRIDATTADPHLRGGFKFPDLISHVMRTRGNLLWACLTLARFWYSAGCPPPSGVPSLGNYTSWVQVIGGVLELAGVGPFLGNLQEGYDRSDSDTDSWAAFFSWWFERFGNESMTTRELVKRSRDGWGSELEEILPEHLAGQFTAFEGGFRNDFLRNLGFALRERRDRVWPNGLVLRRVKTDRNKVAQWQVVKNS